MIELSPAITTVVMLLGFVVLILTGLPVAISIGSVGLIVGFLLFGPKVFDIIYMRFFNILTNYIFVSVPLFVFMGSMLERSGITEKMYSALHLWLGRFRGGLAISTILLGTALAACVGVVGASVTMLTVVSLPSMVKRNYSKSLACGTIVAAGTLGILIPPSIMLIVYGPMAQVSVGKLFMAAFVPGFVLSFLYCCYVAIRCFLQPEIAPAMASGEGSGISFGKKTALLVTALGPTALIVVLVLGVIFLGVAPPTEAAGIGALAATLLVIGYRKFSWQVVKEVSVDTLKLTSMIFLIGGFAFAFVGVFLAADGGQVVQTTLLAAPGGRWGVFFLVMLFVFGLGFFLDWIGILFILVPVVSPLAPALGFDPVWFGMMICLNLQTSFMTPPMAPGIFYLQGSAAPELGIAIGDIMRGVMPFVTLVLVLLVLCIIFPGIILWLPSQMIK